jgi:hypothetical protein
MKKDNKASSLKWLLDTLKNMPEDMAIKHLQINLQHQFDKGYEKAKEFNERQFEV